MPLVAGHDACAGLLKSAHDFVQFFGVQTLREFGRAGEIAKEHRELTPLARRTLGPRGLRRLPRGVALRMGEGVEQTPAMAEQHAQFGEIAIGEKRQRFEVHTIGLEYRRVTFEAKLAKPCRKRIHYATPLCERTRGPSGRFGRAVWHAEGATDRRGRVRLAYRLWWIRTLLISPKRRVWRRFARARHFTLKRSLQRLGRRAHRGARSIGYAGYETFAAKSKRLTMDLSPSQCRHNLNATPSCPAPFARRNQHVCPPLPRFAEAAV